MISIKKPEEYILHIIFLLSSTAVILNIISIATNEWITSTATLDHAAKPSIVSYGLFIGSLENYLISTPFIYDLTATCNYAEGKCIYSCHQSSEKRQDELLKILKGEQLEACAPKTQTLFFDFSLKHAQLKEENPLKSNVEVNVIGSGYWVCTVMFLIIDIIFATAACVFTIINYYWNPVEPILNIFGLYIWNGIAAISGLLTMIIWGALYDKNLKYNIAITDTLRPVDPYNSNGLAILGYSYFILLGGVIFNSLNIGLLYLRNYLLSKVPPPVVIDKCDDTMLTFY